MTSADRLKLAHQMLSSATDLLAAAMRGGEDANNHAARAVWRVADAAALLRAACEAQGIAAPGLQCLTGRGSILPRGSNLD